jgi:crossover junction endodeoxyribonuclease RuvC
MTAPLRIVSLDLSLTATGIAATHDSNGAPRLACRTVTPRRYPASTAIDHRRLHETFAAVSVAVQCRPDLVVIEWLPQFKGHGDVSLRLAELHGALKHWLWSRRLLYVDMLPVHLQMYATGKGRASKQEVREAVTARYGRMLHIGTEDEADAVALLAAALDAYGQPLAEVPTANRKALAGCVWPDLNLPARAPNGVAR